MKYYLISTNAMLAESAFAQTYPYQLALAQAIKEDSGALDALRKGLQKGVIKEVILDNGAYEEELLTDSSIIGVIQTINPTMVVLPDLVDECPKLSHQRSMEFDNKLREIEYQGERMYVPQGRNRTEVLEAFERIFNTAAAQDFVIGVGKCYKFWGSNEMARVDMFREIVQLPNAHRAVFHILGARYDPINTGQFTSYFGGCTNIRGIDTIKPLRGAVNQYMRMMAQYYTGDIIDGFRLKHIGRMPLIPDAIWKHHVALFKELYCVRD